MTPSERNLVKVLVAVAWADGELAGPERGVIEGLLCGFDTSEDEERELLAYAQERRTFDELALNELAPSDRELLLGNAALLVHINEEQSEAERQLLDRLIRLLGFTPEEAAPILKSVVEGAARITKRAPEQQ